MNGLVHKNVKRWNGRWKSRQSAVRRGGQRINREPLRIRLFIRFVWEFVERLPHTFLSLELRKTTEMADEFTQVSSFAHF